MKQSRRKFLRNTVAVAAGFAGLKKLAWAYGSEPPDQIFQHLVPDPAGLIDLPTDFSYRVISRVEETMTDGLLVPWKPDGMATFPGPGGRTLLLCNSEAEVSTSVEGPKGEQARRLSTLPSHLIYDSRLDENQCLGGVSTIIFNTQKQRVEKQFMSLAGTLRNCAGGPTPWNSWISCEETTVKAEDGYGRDHGYNFEVIASARSKLQEPVPLKAMGRFKHEAVAVDPNSGIVYQTEDTNDGLIYRFLPAYPGRLQEGGRLQALAVWSKPGLDTHNWLSGDESTPKVEIPVGTNLAVRWLDLKNVESPDNDLRLQGYYHGAARFARGEGMWYGHGSVFFACTNGGRRRQGQIWRYTPSRFEGTDNEMGTEVGKLMLYAEPNNKGLVENADTLTVAPWGDLIVCEDGWGINRMVGIRPNGTYYELARTSSQSELAGATFSPDGSTLFVNSQQDGVTLAITGSWPFV
tara:strand:- start:12 stop:1403 length:1392 start_codon:yes stop_codon:yes gene_type:complete